MNKMKKKLLYFRLKDDIINVLLYTMFENYNGNADYMKIYAVMTNEVNEVIGSNFNEEMHAKIRSVISSLGRGDLTAVELLDLTKVLDFTITGKPFAIPTVYVEKIQSIEQENRIKLDNKDVSYDITQDIANLNDDGIQEKNEDVFSTLDATGIENTQAIAESSDVLNNNFMTLSGTVDNVEGAVLETNNNLDSVDRSGVSVNKSFDIDDKVVEDVNSKNILEQRCTVESGAHYEAVESLDELEQAVRLIQNYIERIKYESSKKTNKELYNKRVDETTSNIGLQGLETIKQDNVFADGFFEQPAVNEALDNIYVAKTNVPEENVLATENFIETKNQEPVTMPDNFVGKNDTNFSVGGMSPSTLDETGDIFKYIA